MRLSDQYRPTAPFPPLNRKGTVDGFNSAYKPEGAEGSHWSSRQYTSQGISLPDSLKEVSQKDRYQISAMSQDFAKNIHLTVQFLF